MELKLYFGILVFGCLTGSAETVICMKENKDNSLTTISCRSSCCGTLRERQCCPAPEVSKPRKSLATEWIVVVVVVVVVGLVGVVAFTVCICCRQYGHLLCPQNDQEVLTKEPKRRSKTVKSGHDTGFSTGLGGQSAFPARLHPTLIHGFGPPGQRMSLEPGFSSSDHGETSTYGGYFSGHGGASPI